MSDQYDVTIGIPVFRAVSYIQDTMKSALNQSFQNIEFLIVDDCGDDGTIVFISLLQKNHPRGKDIRILRNDQNCGVSYCRNLIIEKARGRFLYFMDADDLIEPNTIQLLFDTVIQKQAQVAYGSYEIIDMLNNGFTQVYQKASMVLEGEDKLALYAFKNVNIFHVSVCNCLIDLTFLRQIGTRFIDVPYWEDMAFTTEFVTKVSCAVLLSEVTYHYIRRPDSLSHYQERNQYDKQEIMRNIAVLENLKSQCNFMRGRPYLPYLCNNLETNSFYLICHILQHFEQIVPCFDWPELKRIMCHPLTLCHILRFRYKMFPNLFFCILGMTPVPIFPKVIRLIKKIKNR